MLGLQFGNEVASIHKLFELLQDTNAKQPVSITEQPAGVTPPSRTLCGKKGVLCPCSLVQGWCSGVLQRSRRREGC